MNKEQLLKLGAWISALIQYLNLAVALLTQISTFLHSSDLSQFASSDHSGIGVNFLVAVGMGILQQFLPRLQKNLFNYAKFTTS